jgi:hypothetical protein
MPKLSKLVKIGLVVGAMAYTFASGDFTVAVHLPGAA